MNTPETLPEDVLAGYLHTDYSFSDGDRTIVIRLDAPNPELLAFLKKEQVTDWAYMTAWNPYSNEQTEEYNCAQQAELLKKLSAYKIWRGEGKGRDGMWPAEESMFVANINKEKARFLGSDYGQYAILVNGENGEPELLICPPFYPSVAEVNCTPI